eukprot:TRINITY_DN1122_c0_g1_i2.p1 TRINITY_DN1122_c0_g1~~TRINITY_DN1122_c0_g1_i2.p1  ORF type:complete len:252 (-),score=74.50 TRINITY_DN1122_c0_g1_i2:67-822(-)
MVLAEFNLATTLYKMDNKYEAQKHLYTMVDLMPNNKRIIIPYTLLGKIELERGNTEKALEHYKRSYDLGSSEYGKKHKYTTRARMGLGKTLSKLGKWEEAIKLIEEQLDIDVNNATNKANELEISFASYFVEKLGEAKEISSDISKQASEILKEKLGYDHEETLKSINAFTDTLLDENNWKEAELVLSNVHDQLHQQFNKLDIGSKIQYKKIEDKLIEALFATGDSENAEKLLLQVERERFIEELNSLKAE